jgi:hypothetical protein
VACSNYQLVAIFICFTFPFCHHVGEKQGTACEFFDFDMIPVKFEHRFVNEWPGGWLAKGQMLRGQIEKSPYSFLV